MNKILLIWATISLTGCSVTRVYKLDSFNQSVKSNIEKLNETNTKISIQQSSILKIGSELKVKDPSNKILSLITEEIKQFEKIKKDTKDFEDFFNNHPISKKSKIVSGDKEYGEMENFQLEISKKQKIINDDFTKFDKDLKAFNSELDSQKIYFVSAKDIKKTMDESFVDFTKKLEETKSIIEKIKTEIAKSKDSDEHKKVLINKLEEMKEEIKVLESTLGEFNRYFANVKNELGNGAETVITPNMQTYKYIDKIRNYADIINSHIQTFNHLANEIKKL
jgi:chromosome segregation ATPase